MGAATSHFFPGGGGVGEREWTTRSNNSRNLPKFLWNSRRETRVIRYTTIGLHTKWIYSFLSIYHEPITHVKRNIKLSLPFRRPKISMIRSIADYRVGICPFKVNKCDAVTDTLLLHGAAEVSFNLRNAPNDRSVVGVNATICTTLFGKMWKRIK